MKRRTLTVWLAIALCSVMLIAAQLLSFKDNMRSRDQHSELLKTARRVDAAKAKIEELGKLEGKILSLGGHLTLAPDTAAIDPDWFTTYSRAMKSHFFVMVWFPSGMCATCLQQRDEYFASISNLAAEKKVPIVVATERMQTFLPFVRIHQISFPILLDRTSRIEALLGEYRHPVYMVVNATSMRIVKALVSIEPFSVDCMDPHVENQFRKCFIDFLTNFSS